MSDILETALDAIRNNRLRSILTILIITIGITSLVGIQTAIEILSNELNDSFGRMGAARMEITAAEKAPPLTVAQAEIFAARFAGVSRERGRDAGNGAEGGEALYPSVMLTVNPIACAAAGGKRTDPIVRLIASDGNWLSCSGTLLAAGRNFLPGETDSGAAVCIIGASIAERLFGRETPHNAIGEEITFGDGAFRIIGVTRRKGASLAPGGDCEAVIPLRNAAGRLRPVESECSITFSCPAGCSAGEISGRAAALLRSIRRLSPGTDNDFLIRSGDSLQETLSSLSSKLSLAALAIGIITLLGAAVGLMNIMLVNVRERRSEIGLRKALGATGGNIAGQFLFESLLICQAGGAAGALLGTAAGNVVALVLEGEFLIPYRWFGIAFLTCAAVSLLSGAVPAGKAAALDPVEALRR